MGEPIGRLMISGHCATPQTAHPEESHARCARMGAGNRANPGKVFCPCPCACHFEHAERFECEACEGVIAEALAWPLDEDGDMRYTHLDHQGNATGEYCP